MKILALDLGDKWIGTALSDTLHMFANPYKTVTAKELYSFLTDTFCQERVSTVIVGYPKTMRGTESDQTKQVVATFNQLAAAFTQVEWKLWDERLSSKHANTLKHAKTKEEKIHAHSIAAAFILTTYLEYLTFQKELNL